MAKNSILLIISGSIAAYKSLDLIRRLNERDVSVRCILTAGGAQFITPLSVASLTGNGVYSDLWSLKDETEMGHIRLSREADVVVVAPASADIIAKMAAGLTDDLATATLLANNKPVLVAPAMNKEMWNHAATQRNIKQIAKDGAIIIAPGEGMLACGETGQGRMAEVDDIVKAIEFHLGSGKKKPRGELAGLRALVTSGPTHEAIDPVRYIANRSSGKQGHAVAEALAEYGADVALVSGPTTLPDPENVNVVRVTSAHEMLAACEKNLPADIAVFAAAVADWRVKESTQKIKKTSAPNFIFTENPDILKTIGTHKKRPKLVIGFAAETENLIKNASAKLKSKNADWILANDVSGGKIFAADKNKITLITAKTQENWPLMSKENVAQKLVERIAIHVKRKAA